MVDPKTGITLNKYGREALMTDPDGIAFPWKRDPKEFWDIFRGDLYFTGQNEGVDCRELKRPKKYIGIYFTDNESVQSREFTRTLTKFYLDCQSEKEFTTSFAPHSGYTFDVVLAPCMDTE